MLRRMSGRRAKKKGQKRSVLVHHHGMATRLPFTINRSAKVTLAEQIRKGITDAIDKGLLVPGARLPSWRDLAAQLGVARGTVRAAYERLVDAQLIISSTPGGTRVAERPVMRRQVDVLGNRRSFIPGVYREFSAAPAIFQMGVPAQDSFPSKLISRIRVRTVRAEALAAASYPDPRGELELRRELAVQLAIARGIECTPSQIIITSGFSGGLGLTLRVLGLEGRSAWVEDPSFPLTRKGLEIARLQLIPVPVDEHGLDVAYGLKAAPDAALVIVTPGQQAPLGATLSPERRLRLLEWATEKSAWIIEDDYLSELKLKGRSAPALASLDKQGRVIHLGSFSKTISPTFRLGFIVAPVSIAEQFAEAAACLSPAPCPSVQIATAEFIREGHYMRHLRRTKRIYAQRSDALVSCLKFHGCRTSTAGLVVLLHLPAGVADTVIANEALAFGLAPSPLSHWYMSETARATGLLLNVAAAPMQIIPSACERLCEIINRRE
jgi:GntR family transcriptional regulator / MocR family aminotransferase